MEQPSPEEVEDMGPTTIGEHRDEPRWSSYHPFEYKGVQESELNDAVGL
jgi:hypothetical protein